LENNQFALITGTSSGLGLEMAQYLLETGYNVIGLSRRGSPIEHSSYIDIICDLRDESSVMEVFDLISESTGSLDLIILNAGIFEMSPLVETSSLEFTNHLNTNVLGAFHVMKHARDFIVENETHIVTISSIASKKGLANISAYSASKFALNGMIDSLKEEWSHLGVRFSTLMPGAIATEIWDNEANDLPREQMLLMEDFMHVFKMVVTSSPNIQFPELVFLHSKGPMT